MRRAGPLGYRSRRFTPAPRVAHPDCAGLNTTSADPCKGPSGERSPRNQSGSACVHPPLPPKRCTFRRRVASTSTWKRFPLDGQAGALVGIAGRLVCLDYVSRSDVFAGLYLKLLRGYALSAIERPVDRPLRRRDLGRFLGELELAKRDRRPAVGLGEEGLFLTEYAVGAELSLDHEVMALSAFPGQAWAEPDEQR